MARQECRRERLKVCQQDAKRLSCRPKRLVKLRAGHDAKPPKPAANFLTHLAIFGARRKLRDGPPRPEHDLTRCVGCGESETMCALPSTFTLRVINASFVTSSRLRVAVTSTLLYALQLTLPSHQQPSALALFASAHATHGT